MLNDSKSDNRSIKQIDGNSFENGLNNLSEISNRDIKTGDHHRTFSNFNSEKDLNLSGILPVPFSDLHKKQSSDTYNEL